MNAWFVLIVLVKEQEYGIVRIVLQYFTLDASRNGQMQAVKVIHGLVLGVDMNLKEKLKQHVFVERWQNQNMIQILAIMANSRS